LEKVGKMSKRYKTKYPGIFFRMSNRISGKGTERVYYIVFKQEGLVHEEKVGRQYTDNMTPAKAARIRAERIEGKRLSRKQIRELKKSMEEVWNIDRLWKEYKNQKPDLQDRRTDVGGLHRRTQTTCTRE